MPQVTLNLTVRYKRKVVATLNFSLEVPELRPHLEFNYRLGGPHAHRYRKVFGMWQKDVFHPTAPPDSWHNLFSFYPDRPGTGWTEHLPVYEASVSLAGLAQLLEFCMPQNGFVELASSAPAIG